MMLVKNLIRKVAGFHTRYLTCVQAQILCHSHCCVERKAEVRLSSSHPWQKGGMFDEFGVLTSKLP